MNRRIAVLADIHSNHLALETCLGEAGRRHAEEFFFLGDYLGELAYPGKTLELLDQTAKQYPCVFIRGNKEDYWIEHYRGIGDWKWQAGTSGSGMLAYVYERLTPERIESFGNMPVSATIRESGFPPFVICHGSPWRTNESLRREHDYIDERTGQLETELTVCGHFHMQCDYTLNGKRVVNPGAVGIPLKSGGQTQFMMLTGENGQWRTEFVSLPYDRERAVQEMDDEKLSVQAPGWYRVTREILRGRDITHKTVLTKAHDMYKRAEGADDWRYIPEKYWNMALAELGIPE